MRAQSSHQKMPKRQHGSCNKSSQARRCYSGKSPHPHQSNNADENSQSTRSREGPTTAHCQRRRDITSAHYALQENTSSSYGQAQYYSMTIGQEQYVNSSQTQVDDVESSTIDYASTLRMIPNLGDLASIPSPGSYAYPRLLDPFDLEPDIPSPHHPSPRNEVHHEGFGRPWPQDPNQLALASTSHDVYLDTRDSYSLSRWIAEPAVNGPYHTIDSVCDHCHKPCRECRDAEPNFSAHRSPGCSKPIGCRRKQPRSA